MDSDQALARVGVPNPRGNPQQLQDSAQSWQELSTHLREHRDRLLALLSQSQQSWQGTAANAFHERIRDLANIAGQAAEVASEVGAKVQAHAEQHAKVLEIIKELGIQIAVTLAFIAAAWAFPWLLAAAEAYLVVLAVQGGRVVEMLADALSMLTRALMQARTWLEALGKLKWSGESFSLGYGRIIADGARDFSIDLMANTTTTAVQHKKLDPGQLFLSAAVSFGVGGVVGGLEASGAKQLRTATGDIVRGTDGRPKFASFGKQIKGQLKKIGGKNGDTAPRRDGSAGEEPAVQAKTPSQQIFDRLSRAEAASRQHGVIRMNRQQLTDNVASAARERDAAVARQATVGRARAQAAESLRDSQQTLDRRTADLHQTRSELLSAHSGLWSSRVVHDLARTSGDESWIREAEQQMRNAEQHHATTYENYNTASSALTGARAAHAEAVRNQVNASRDLHDATTAAVENGKQLAEAEARLSAWTELRNAREAALRTTSTERVRNALRNNPWRAGYPTSFAESGAEEATELKPSGWEKTGRGSLGQHALRGFGNPKKWQEIVFYDGIKDGLKGATSSAALGGINAAEGTADPHDIWKNVLLGAAGGSARGMVNGKFANVAYPKDGLEEIAWKSGTKSLDKFARDQAEAALDQQQASPDQQTLPYQQTLPDQQTLELRA